MPTGHIRSTGRRREISALSSQLLRRLSLSALKKEKALFIFGPGTWLELGRIVAWSQVVRAHRGRLQGDVCAFPLAI